MILYRLYIDGIKGYKHLGTYDAEQTIKSLDNLILEKNCPEKILAIEQNVEDNMDFPVFLYLGNQEEYMNFRNYLEDTTIKRETKKFVRR